jgi:hypothetical protein
MVSTATYALIFTLLERRRERRRERQRIEDDRRYFIIERMKARHEEALKAATRGPVLRPLPKSARARFVDRLKGKTVPEKMNKSAQRQRDSR